MNTLQRRTLMGSLGLLGCFCLACSPVIAQCAGNELQQSQAQLGELVSSSLKNTWESQLTGPLYASISSVGAILVLLTIGWYALKVMKVHLSHSDLQLASIEEWVIAIVMILLLSNSGSGSLLGTISIGFRAASSGMSNQILAQISESQAVVAEGQAKLSIEAWANDQATYCAAIANQEHRNQCFIQATDILANKLSCYQSTSWAQETFLYYQNKFLQSTSNPGEYGTSDFFVRLFGGLGTLSNSISSSLIMTWLAAIGTGILLMIDTAMLLTAMMGPIFLGLSFLPIPLKPIQIWATGLASLAMTELAYKILIGVISSSMLEAPPSDPLVWQLMLALFSPLLVFGMAAGGGIALMNSMGRATTAVVRV